MFRSFDYSIEIIHVQFKGVNASMALTSCIVSLKMGGVSTVVSECETGNVVDEVSKSSKVNMATFYTPY